jgi:hypothetical protein
MRPDLQFVVLPARRKDTPSARYAAGKGLGCRGRIRYGAPRSASVIRTSCPSFGTVLPIMTVGDKMPFLGKLDRRLATWRSRRHANPADHHFCISYNVNGNGATVTSLSSFRQLIRNTLGKSARRMPNGFDVSQLQFRRPQLRARPSSALHSNPTWHKMPPTTKITSAR